MDELTRQIVILVTVMTLLSIINYFLINISETPEAPSAPSPNISTPEIEPYTGPGSGILNQSLYGLNALYNDLHSYEENQTKN